MFAFYFLTGFYIYCHEKNLKKEKIIFFLLGIPNSFFYKVYILISNLGFNIQLRIFFLHSHMTFYAKFIIV